MKTTEDNHIKEDNDSEEENEGEDTNREYREAADIGIENEEHDMEVDNQAIPDDYIHMEDAEREGPSQS